MENEQYEQQMSWEVDQNCEGEALNAQAESEIQQNCFDCGRKNDGENCVAGGVHDIEIDIATTAHDIHIYDTKHSDNAITITKQEARHLVDILQSELIKENK